MKMSVLIFSFDMQINPPVWSLLKDSLSYCHTF